MCEDQIYNIETKTLIKILRNHEFLFFNNARRDLVILIEAPTFCVYYDECMK